MQERNLAQAPASGQYDALKPPEPPGRPTGPDERAGEPSNGSPKDRSEQTFRFLRFLFGEEAPVGFVEFRFFSSGPKPRVAGRSLYYPLPLDEEAVARDVLSRNGKQMITVGPAPRCRKPEEGEGKDRDIVACHCIWADLDYKDFERGALEVEERLAAFPLRPSIVVGSGFGKHVYFVFNTVLRDSGLVEWDKLIRGLRDALGGDAVFNPSRVMRLPGTYNLKLSAPVPSRLCEEESSWLRYSPGEVRAAIEKALAAKPAPVSQPLSAPLPKDWSFSALDLRGRGVPADVVNAVVTGKRTIRTGRSAGRDDDDSARDFWVATTLLERGLSEEEVAAIFRANPKGVGSKVARPNAGEEYLRTTLDKARARVAEKKADAQARGVGDEEEDVEVDKPKLLPPCYEEKLDGSVWFCPPSDDDSKRPPRPTKVSDSPMRIVEIREAIDTGQLSYQIEFELHGRARTAVITRAQLVDTRQLVAALGGEGAPVTTLNVRPVLGYLTAYENAFHAEIPRRKVTSRFGRGSGGTFFLPGLSDDVEFAPTGPGDSSLYRAYSSRRGTLRGWLDALDLLNSATLMIPQAAVLASFVPPLQRTLQIPNFILDIYGNTSTGKSTTLRLAASVWGKPADPDGLLQQWHGTKVSVEQIAHLCSELPVYLDDAQHCADELKRTVVYMIANGKGKGRGSRGGGIRETPTWHTVGLSTSEEPLHEASPSEGARGRLLPVGGLTPPFRPGSGSLVQALERTVTQHHGHAGEAFVRHLNDWTQSDWFKVQQRYFEIRSELQRRSSSDLVGRVSAYIAALQVAGEVACPLLGIPFDPEVVAAWLLLHLHEQQSEQNLVLLALRSLADHYVSNQAAFAGTVHFDPSRVRSLQGALKQGAYVAFLRSTLDEVFQKRRWNATAILNKLADAGALHTTEGDRHTKRVSVEGVSHRMVCVKWTALFPGDSPVSNETT